VSVYRPITDVWMLARSKTKYYGAYPCGFLGRARDLLGVGPTCKVLHVCSGKLHDYPSDWRGYPGPGLSDFTLDCDQRLDPDLCCDVRNGIPLCHVPRPSPESDQLAPWDAILCDPPYSPEDAKHYQSGSELYPEPQKLLADCLKAVKPGGKVGFLHYILPRPPKGAQLVACVAVVVGFGNRGRLYSVFERRYEQ
jgi:hypothetical protein